LLFTNTIVKALQLVNKKFGMLKFHRVLVITNLDLDSLAFSASPFKKVAGVYPQKLHGYTIQSTSNNSFSLACSIFMVHSKLSSVLYK
jgi:hypothetical protein